MVDSTKLQKIKYTSYDLQKEWLEQIAPTYFELDDTSLNRTGLFGYINEVMSNVTENSFLTTTILANEVFPNRAILPNSIYSYASLANYWDFNYKPARIDFLLFLRKSELIAMSEEVGNHIFSYKIDRHSFLNVNDEIKFILDYDVNIRMKVNNNEVGFNAFYDTSYHNSISNITNPFIKYMVYNHKNEDYLVLNLFGRQLEKQTKTIIVYSKDIIDSTNYEITYDGFLSDFTVRNVNKKTNEIIPLKKYFVDAFRPPSGKICFYEFFGSNKINIRFSPYPSYFRPEYGTELIFDIYTTLGKNGNFKYKNAPAVFEFVTDDSEKIPRNFVSIMTDSTGGMDGLSIDGIKQKTIKAFSARGNIINDNDLQNYFEDISSKTNILFTKKRDDILVRSYSAFLFMKDEEDNIIPSNTINLIVNNKDIIKNGFIKPGTIFESYSREKNMHIIPEKKYDEIDILQIERERKKFLYTTPFLIKIDKDPFLASYYINSMNENVVLNFTYLNPDSINEIFANNLNIIRNSIFENTYHFNLRINTTLALNQIFTQLPNGTVKDTGLIKIYGIIKEKGIRKGYIKFKLDDYEKDNQDIIYTANLNTDDFIDDKENLRITKSIYEFSQTTEILNEETFFTEDLEIDICIFYNGSSILSKSDIELLFPNIPDYRLVSVFSSASKFSLHKKLGSYLYSPILLKQDQNDDFYYVIKMMPVIRYSYMMQFKTQTYVINEINKIKLIFDDIMRDLENNFNIEMKFYNTYGYSKFFKINREKNDEKENLDHVNISLDLEIKLKQEVSNNLYASIKNFIIDFIEETNNINNSFLYISNLLRNLETEFDDIVYVIFNNFNKYETNIQSIENTFSSIYDLTREELINFVPEYLNVQKDLQKDDYGNIVFVPNIRIKFV